MAIPKLIHYSDNSYVTSQGTLLEGFETFADWTITGTGASGSGDSTHKKQGLQSLRLNSVNGAKAYATKTISEDLSSATNFILWVYVDDNVALDNFNLLEIYFTSVSDWSKYFWDAIPATDCKHGWNRLTLEKSNFVNIGSESWSNTMIRFRVICKALTGKNVSICFDDFRYNHVAGTKCILTFDDGTSGHYDYAKPRMDTNGQAGVAFITTSVIGDGGQLTKAQLTIMQSAGWDISNHTRTHPDLTDYSYMTQVTIEEQIDDAYDWLVTNGFSAGAKFFAYPFGHYDQAVITKVKERHRIARCSIGGIYQAHFSMLDNDQEFLMKAIWPDASTSTATVEDWIDRAIVQKGLLVFLFHEIVASGATGSEINRANFEALSDYLKTKQDAELIEVVTLSDYDDQFMPSNLTSVVYLEHGPLVPYRIAYEPAESVGRAEDGRIKVYKHPLAGDKKRIWRIKCIIDNSGSSGYKWRDLEYFYTKVVEGAKHRCVFVDANSVQYLVRIIDFAPRAIGLNNRHEVTMILEEDYA